MKRVRGALDLVRRRVGSMIGVAGFMLPLSVVLSPAIIGLPLMGTSFRSMLRSLIRAGRERAGRPAPARVAKGWAGPITMIAVALFAGAVALVVLAVQHVLPPGSSALWISLAVGALASVGLGVALAPLQFAPLYAADGVDGVFAPFSRSFQLAARMGAAESRRLGALVGAALGLGFIGVTAAFLWGHTGIGSFLIAIPFCYVVGPPLAVALLADAFVEHELAGESDAAEPVVARVRGLWGLLVPALIGVGAAFVAAALSPSPMRAVSRPESFVRGFHGVGTVHGSQTRRIPGTTVQVRTTGHGIAIEADDGGGAGEVSARFDTQDVGLYLFEREETPGTYFIAITDGSHWATTVVDEDGVRLDDSLSQRVFGRLGRVGLAALGLGMLLLLWIAFSLGSELGTARALDVPSLFEEGRRTRGLSALEGTLRIADESKVRYRPGGAAKRLIGHMAAGSLSAEGDAWVEADAGTIRLRLPDRAVPVLEGDAKEWAGEHVVVLSRFAALSATGLRTSSVPWPEDGVITLGRRRDASQALVSRAVKRASRVALPTLLLLGAAAAKILWAI